MDEDEVFTRKNAILVAHGFSQLEWLGYDKTISPVERLEGIRLFLAY